MMSVLVFRHEDGSLWITAFDGPGSRAALTSEEAQWLRNHQPVPVIPSSTRRSPLSTGSVLRGERKGQTFYVQGNEGLVSTCLASRGPHAARVPRDGHRRHISSRDERLKQFPREAVRLA